MNIETMSESRKTATEKWREYRNAEKVSDNPIYKDLKKVYNQLKGGRKIIDIFKVIQKGGINNEHLPTMAIAKASSKFVWCTYDPNGQIQFVNRKSRYSWDNNNGASPIMEDVSFGNWLPEFSTATLKSKGLMKENDWSFRLKAPVPLIPPKHLPVNLTDDYYILWEVDKWAMVAPTDPYLLKRITKNLFVVLAAWDLTPMEKAVMEGRMS